MKLIQILVLATAMAILATAQNPGANNASSAGQPTATPTPVGKTASTPAKSAPGTKPTPATSAVNSTQTGNKKASGATNTGKPVVTPVPAAKSGTASVAPANTKTGKPSGTPASSVKSGTSAKLPVATGTLAKGKTPPVVKAGANANVKPGSTKSPTPVQAKPSGKAPAVIAVQPKATPTPAKTSASGKSVPAVPAKVAVVPPPAVAEKKPPVRPMGAAGRRDPFVSPIRSMGAVGPGSNCTTGKRCLSIPELVLQGTVRDISGKMMAVVVTSSSRTYTLRENDQVFNGSVEKITTDSIIFREYVKDALGRETAREVVKKMVPAS